ncbi:MAG: aminoglycoside phosphotransferase family protein [Gemmatimonadota bacterium]|nr:aminoglycoside phosphotransferase family protein [Gemmatimonadota bacterium]
MRRLGSQCDRTNLLSVQALDTKYPRAEVQVGVDLVQRLLREQHPDLAELKITLVDVGWDNVTHRVGDELAVRMPRREAAVQLLLKEQRWLSTLADWIDIPVPRLVRAGRPSSAFRWPWSVVQWLPGQTCDVTPLSADQAQVLGLNLRRLHRRAPPDAPTNPSRGVPLQQRDEFVQTCLEALSHSISAHRGDSLRWLWSDGLRAPKSELSVWLHGDLHPRNVLSRGGLLSGILDWGDLASGDPATDLASAWMLFDGREAPSAVFESYGASPALALRARSWAVFFGAALSNTEDARHLSIGRRIIDRLVRHAERDT